MCDEGGIGDRPNEDKLDDDDQFLADRYQPHADPFETIRLE
jgi:hypothetical protein